MTSRLRSSCSLVPLWHMIFGGLSPAGAVSMVSSPHATKLEICPHTQPARSMTTARGSRAHKTRERERERETESLIYIYIYTYIYIYRERERERQNNIVNELMRIYAECPKFQEAPKVALVTPGLLVAGLQAHPELQAAPAGALAAWTRALRRFWGFQNPILGVLAKLGS